MTTTGTSKIEKLSKLIRGADAREIKTLIDFLIEMYAVERSAEIYTSAAEKMSHEE